jgi:hypothetical protein
MGYSLLKFTTIFTKEKAMKKKLFLFAILVLSSFRILYSQTTWINDEKDLTASSTNIEQFKNKGGTQTVYQSSTYAIGRKLNTDSSSFISRSYHQFNINQSVFPTNTQIDEVTVHYTTSAGSYSYKLTKVTAVGTDNAANWSAIGSGTSMDAGIAYSAVENSFVSAKIKTEMQNLLTSGTIILGALSENETANDSYADLFIWLHVKFRRPAKTFDYVLRNYYKDQNGVGIIGLGLGTTPDTVASPYTFNATEKQNINLLAYDNQDISTRRYLFNDTEAPQVKSKWEQDISGIVLDLGLTQSITVVASSTNDGASFRAWLKQNCKIDQTHNTEFDGNLTQQNLKYIVEQNNGSIIAPSSKTVASNNYNFAGWIDDITLPTTRQINNPTDNQTYTALYKATHKSNSTTAYSNPSQRRFIQTPDGVKHICYESMGKVWYELSTDNGATWILGNGGKPLSSTDAKNPSMSFYGNQIGIVYQEKSGNSFKIKMTVLYGNNYSSSVFSTVADEDLLLDYSHNANPVIAWGYNGKVVVVWSGNDLCANPFGGTALKYAYGSASSNGITWYMQCGIDGTDVNSINPTIVANYSVDASPFYFHIAWEQFVNSSTSKINYCMLSANANNYLQHTTFEEASYNSGYSKNYQPSILLRNVNSQDLPYLTWLGYRSTPSASSRVVMRYKQYGSWSPLSIYGGNSVQSFSINNAGFLYGQYVLGLGWSEPVSQGSTTYFNKAVKIGSSTTINTLSTTGKDLQINNSSSYSSMFVNSFQSKTLPYIFSLSQPFVSLGKENSIAMLNAREGVVGKNGAQFFFALGDISVNGQNIDFVEIPDSIKIDNLEIINTCFESKPITVNEHSNLTYGVEYGIADSVLCSSLLSNNGNITFKVVLIDDKTNEVLDVFDEVTYSGKNVYQYNNVGYQVNLAGIGERTIRLGLAVNTNLNFDYSLSDRISDQSLLAKTSYQTINYKGKLAITEYALDQNYPNPFNPSTTIKFQLPKDGFVTLKVYDILGKEITTLINEEKSQGKYEVNFNASSLSSGVYIYKIQAGDFTASKKLILLK